VRTGSSSRQAVRAAVSVVVIAMVLVSCSASPHLTIGDAESIGFQKGSQQLYTMIGAIDGWSGTFDGETVELYEYESASDTSTDFFQSAVAPGNVSGWVEYCKVENLAMLSKGTKACKSLQTLSG
jgi:hypothetical protein